MNPRIEKQVIEYISNAIGRTYSCPICGGKEAILGDGYISNILKEMKKDNGSFAFPGPSIPAIFLVCSHCGYISQHSAGVLFRGLENFFSLLNEEGGEK